MLVAFRLINLFVFHISPTNGPKQLRVRHCERRRYVSEGATRPCYHHRTWEIEEKQVYLFNSFSSLVSARAPTVRVPQCFRAVTSFFSFSGNHREPVTALFADLSLAVEWMMGERIHCAAPDWRAALLNRIELPCVLLIKLPFHVKRHRESLRVAADSRHLLGQSCSKNCLRCANLFHVDAVYPLPCSYFNQVALDRRFSKCHEYSVIFRPEKFRTSTLHSVSKNENHIEK